MTRMTFKYSHYSFERNAGYGTAEHWQALAKLGICDIYRHSYRFLKLCTTSARILRYNKKNIRSYKFHEVEKQKSSENTKTAAK